MSGINTLGEKLRVTFDGKSIDYDFDELDQIGLAYATSIHKSQGSEYPAVVIPLHTSHYPMLHRSILYTAVTLSFGLIPQAKENLCATEELSLMHNPQDLIERHDLGTRLIRRLSKGAVATEITTQVGERYKYLGRKTQGHF